MFLQVIISVLYMYCRTGEKLEISVSSKELLFSPVKTEVAVLGGNYVHIFLVK